MMQEKRERARLEITPTQSVVYEREQVTVAISRWRLHILCDKLIKGEARHKLDDAWPWLGAFLAFLLAPLTTDKFQDFLGVGSSTWETIIIGGILITAFLFARAIYLAVKDFSLRPPTAEEAVQDIINEMQPPTNEGVIAQPSLGKEERRL